MPFLDVVLQVPRTISLLLFNFWNFAIKLNKKCPVVLLRLKFLCCSNLKKCCGLALIILPLFGTAQQKDTLLHNKDTLKVIADTGKKVPLQAGKVTRVSGQVTDAVTGRPLALISINFSGSGHGTSSDSQGKYYLIAAGSYKKVSFSYEGYQQVTVTVIPGQDNNVSVRLKKSLTQLKEVVITSGKNKRYRNKGNPAVELIQQVIDHKDQNRMESSAYLQYDQYERIGLSFFNLSPQFINGRFFSKYKFMLDTTFSINGQTKTALPVFFSEKLSQHFYRKSPAKTIEVLNAQKEINIIRFVDTVGLDIYLNRLYGDNIDIYSNNIFLVTNQFLSPIADHAPDFYKFFIIDTVQSGNKKLVELSFTPRTKGDLLFEGKLLVTLDGRYAVQSCELNVNKQININFMRSLQISLDFDQYPGGRYYLKKSDVKADFGVLRNKGTGVFGERTVFYSNYKLDSPLTAAFYRGKSLQTAANYSKPDTGYWTQHRTDTLTTQQAQVYAHINKLESMTSFKRLSWVASTLAGGYGDLGPVEVGPIGSIYSFDSVEGSRFWMGGRTTPKFNKSIYLEGYAAYGTTDKQLKYDLTTYYSLNKTPYYRFPNDYFKVTYQYDVDVPGTVFAINNTQRALSSFHTGKSDYWLYSRIFNIGYVKDFENHFSYSLAFKNWNQQPAGTLIYQVNDPGNSIVHTLTTSEADLALRYAPHEQILQGTMFRRTVYGKYPIFNLQVNHGFAGVLNGSYSYTNISANIFKRFYLSQLGYTDVTLLGGLLTGKVPFPLLMISPANQSFGYDPNAYNLMNYLEFVSDHYAGLNVTHAFNGFLLNKVPLIEHLKWREFLSLKVLYGGLRNENNPLYTKGLYNFPIAANGANGTYALGSTPYVEAGAGIGNIFKILRIDVIRRFNYLDHPGIAPYGIKFSFTPGF